MKGTLATLIAVLFAPSVLAADAGWPNWRGTSEHEAAETGQSFTGKLTNALGQDLIDIVAILGHLS